MSGNLNYPVGSPYPSASQEQYTATRAPSGITVSELERLAKAGVKVELTETLAGYVRPDPAPQGALMDASELLKPLMQRWKRFKDISAGNKHPLYDDYLHKYPFHLSAWANETTVFIFVCPTTVDHPPLILTDEPLVYPSDTLMAKLHLLVETQPSKGGVQVDQPYAGGVQQPTASVPGRGRIPSP